VHFTILIDLLLHLYLETALHVILFMVKSLMNSVNSLLHLIYVHCFPIVIFQRYKLSHVFSLESSHDSVCIDLKQLISFILSQVFTPFPYLEVLFSICVLIRLQLCHHLLVCF